MPRTPFSENNLPRAFLKMCRANMRRPKVADTTGVELNGAAMLMRTLILRKLLVREVLADEEKFVGVLIPPSVGAVLVNAALPLCGRIPVNLNYTVSSAVMNSCIAQCGIRHVLTSRKVMQRFKFELDAELVYLEDFRDKVRATDKLAAAVSAWIEPRALLERRLGVGKVSPDDLLTVIFTSGSTGEPKGVMLTNRNVASNVSAVDELIHLSNHDVLAGILPFFHSTGFTTTLWTALTLAPKGVYHTNPIEGQQVGEMCRKHRVTIMVAAPTFLRTYLRRCLPEDFASMEVVLTGAEKLPVDLCDAFERKFGVRPAEGYGTTELSPIAAVNVPQSRATGPAKSPCAEGTVGRPIPHVQVKVVDPDTGAELGSNQPGLLWFKGPNVMKGYLNQPELTAQKIKDGWYNTGDIGLVTSAGCVQITGRESRFSKIGGEMVPHIKIEEKLQALLSADADEIKAAVTAVPDPRKGEKIVVVHGPMDKTPHELCRMLAGELPNIWIPAPENFFQVDEIPVLGTGKLDLKALKDLAVAHFAEPPKGQAE